MCVIYRPDRIAKRSANMGETKSQKIKRTREKQDKANKNTEIAKENRETKQDTRPPRTLEMVTEERGIEKDN